MARAEAARAHRYAELATALATGWHIHRAHAWNRPLRLLWVMTPEELRRAHADLHGVARIGP